MSNPPLSPIDPRSEFLGDTVTASQPTSDTIRLRRSALYTPATSRRLLTKAAGTAADVLIIDLEDAIAPEFKDAARQVAQHALPDLLKTRKEIVVRVNSPSSSWIDADLEAVCGLGISGVLFPKVSSRSAIESAVSKLDAVSGGSQVGVWCMIETPEAILNLQSMALCAQDNRVRAWVVGTNDLAKDLRLRHTRLREHLIPALSHIVIAARAYDLCVLDGVHNAVHDSSAYEAVCKQGADMGFDGKTLIHPSQVDPCNRLFSPSESDIERAQRIVEAFDRPANAGRGVIQLDGEMVELLHAREARRVLALAASIAELQRESSRATPG
jgi:citrate lyase subunit beta/citryl-CoA lyase